MPESKPIEFSSKTFLPVDGIDESLSPIILMHGLTATKESLDIVSQSIADKTKRKIYAYDARNHGDSEFTEEFSFDLNVEDLFHFMDTMNIEKAVLVGHSMGGQTATNAALKKPERIEAIFSEDMYVKKIPKDIFHHISNFVHGYIKATESIPKEMSESEAIKYLLDCLFGNAPEDSPLHHEKENMYKSKFRLKKTPDGSYDVSFNKKVLLRAMENPDSLMSEPQGQYYGPAVFIYGGLSTFYVGSEEEHIKKHFPNAELVEFAEANHNLHVEFPEKFVEKIVQTLQKGV